MANVKVYYPESFNILSNLFNKNLNNYIIYNELDFKKILICLIEKHPLIIFLLLVILKNLIRYL